MIILGLIGIFVLLILVLQGCRPPQPPPPQPPDLPEDSPKYRALFVGVSKYDNYQGTMDLPSPAKNAERLRTLFNKFRYTEYNIPFIEIRTLINHDASAQGILNAIAETFKDSKENDINFLYYMGHGGTVNGVPMITAADYKASLPSTYITVHKLKAEFDKIKGNHVILLETCHSGNFIERDARGLRIDYDKAIIEIFSLIPRDTINRPGYYVITSSAGNQYSWDNRLGWSYFCRPFIDGCEGLKADTDNDSKVSLNEIYIYVRDWLAKQTLPEPQTPQVYPEDSDFIIGEY